MIRATYFLGIGCAIVVIFAGLIGLGVVQIIYPEFFPSPAFSIIEDIIGFFVFVFLACSVITWSYAYRTTKSQWSSMDSEQRLLRVILLMFAFFLIGYFIFYREEIRKKELVT